MATEPQDRTPEQVTSDTDWLRRLREARANDPRRGRFGGTEEITDELVDTTPRCPRCRRPVKDSDCWSCLIDLDLEDAAAEGRAS
jgi:hypothetical protein